MSSITSSSSAEVIPFAPSFTQASQNWFRQWRRNDQFNHSDRTFIAELFDHFNFEIYRDTGELIAWPSWLTIAEAGLSKRSIARSAKKVEQLGAVEIARSRDPKTDWQLQNKYRALPGAKLAHGRVPNPGARMAHEKTKEEMNREGEAEKKASGLPREARERKEGRKEGRKKDGRKNPRVFLAASPCEAGLRPRRGRPGRVLGAHRTAIQGENAVARGLASGAGIDAARGGAA